MLAVVMLIVPKEDRRRFLLTAHELEMTKGDFVFYTIEMLPEENVLNPEDVWASNDRKNTIAKEAFEAVFHVRSVAAAAKMLDWVAAAKWDNDVSLSPF